MDCDLGALGNLGDLIKNAYKRTIIYKSHAHIFALHFKNEVSYTKFV